VSAPTPEGFRAVLGHVPTPVVVVTAMGDDGPLGLAIGSFTSVSLDPLLVGFFPARTSGSWAAMRGVGSFCVNVLADDQHDVCRTFATRGADRFAAVGWRPAPSGAPVLDDAVAWIDCALHQELDAGDHLLVLGLVTALDLTRDVPALVFHRGDYTTTG
jgi:3-hydroxy-9,10-secoandrosta-1,3,5(10)-triene-9,17-dione monooxygenase reductase component